MRGRLAEPQQRNGGSRRRQNAASSDNCRQEIVVVRNECDMVVGGKLACQRDEIESHVDVDLLLFEAVKAGREAVWASGASARSHAAKPTLERGELAVWKVTGRMVGLDLETRQVRARGNRVRQHDRWPRIARKTKHVVGELKCDAAYLVAERKRGWDLLLVILRRAIP